MAGLQSIIDISNSLEINRRKMVGIQYARNELPRVSETPTYNPWKLTVSVPSSLRYNEARQILESLDTLDRRTPETVTFSNNPNMSWMFAYQGDLTLSQRSQVFYSSFTGNQLVLDVSGVSAPSNALIFKQGDFLQMYGFPYPFTSTTNVYRGSGSTVTVTTHRPNIFSTNPTPGTGLNFGNSVAFRVFCPNMPVYRLNVGAAKSFNGVLINNAVIEFADNFRLYEYVASA